MNQLLIPKTIWWHFIMAHWKIFNTIKEIIPKEQIFTWFIKKDILIHFQKWQRNKTLTHTLPKAHQITTIYRAIINEQPEVWQKSFSITKGILKKPTRWIGGAETQ